MRKPLASQCGRRRLKGLGMHGHFSATQSELLCRGRGFCHLLTWPAPSVGVPRLCTAGTLSYISQDVLTFGSNRAFVLLSKIHIQPFKEFADAEQHDYT